ncbi:MAG: hypothetical protein GXP30_14815 [Verrucomicrobia bacterium]|nr:hypothetical protein [Verrucomicrobiota bacterium]
MKVFEGGALQGEPEWQSIGITRTDFRPHWDGDLVNVWSVIKPRESESETVAFVEDCVKGLAGWIFENKKKFGEEDRFQIILGWSEVLRENDRQLVKIGGFYDEIDKIAKGDTPVTFRSGWSTGIFD